jgi:hypothetical protein
MGIFPYEIIWRDIPFKKKLWAQNDDLEFQQGHINFSGVNNPAEIVSAGSLTPCTKNRPALV